VPDSPDGEAFDPYARTPEGDKAIFRVTPRVPAATFCTAHVFQQIPGQDRIFMGWYTQGTVVVDFVENADGTFEFSEAGYFIPENANTWVSHVFKVDDNGDGTFTYFGATGDFNLGGAGRNAVDVYSVTLPAPASASVGEGTDPDAEDPDGAPDDGDDSDSAPDDDDDTDGAPEGGDGSPGNGGSLAATGGGVAGLAALLLGAATVTTRRRRRSG
jgi:hypothetical protein